MKSIYCQLFFIKISKKVDFLSFISYNVLDSKEEAWKMGIGGRIKKRREELGYTQEQLAEKMGYKSKSTINKIEAGINDITQSKITAFAEALKTTPSYLMGWKEEKEDPKKDSLILSNLTKKEKLDYDKFMDDATYYFNDESISDEDKEKLFKSFQEVYFTVMLGKKKK